MHTCACGLLPEFEEYEGNRIAKTAKVGPGEWAHHEELTRVVSGQPHRCEPCELTHVENPWNGD